MPFGQAIPVLGPLVGFPGHYSRTEDTIIKSRVVLSSSANPLSFGAGVVLIPSATGGSWQSLSDYLATATNAQYIQQNFAGVCVWNFKTQQPYSALSQSPPTASVSTTGTASSASTALTVASGTGIAVGQSVEGAGIAPNTTVTAVSGTAITLSLSTQYALSSTNVTFITLNTSPAVGSYTQGTEGEVLLRSSVTVAITNGTPQAGYPVYIRTVANASTPGTSVGDFEAAAEVATSSRTYGCTIGSATFTTDAATGLAPGQYVTGPAIPNNTYIVSGATSTWVFSNAATATIASGAALTAYNTGLLGSATEPWLKFTLGQQDTNGMAEIIILGRHV